MKNGLILFLTYYTFFYQPISAEDQSANHPVSAPVSGGATSSSNLSVDTIVNQNKVNTNNIDPEDPLAKQSLSQALNSMGTHGWAIIDRIRNDTEFPVDIFYNKTLHDLLPPDTEFRIKSIKREYALQATAASDASTAATSKTATDTAQATKDKTKTSAAENNQQNTGDNTTVLPKNTQPFKYLAARNLAGNFRLKADTIDANDPATLFVIRKHINADLQTFLGIEAKINPKGLLRTKKNNEAIFTKTSSLDLITKDGQKSNDNFDSDFDIDAHWLLYSKGVQPEDPIDPTTGSYLQSCSLKNRERNGFLSVRSAEDEKSQIHYVKSCFWYWVAGPREHNCSTLDYKEDAYGPNSLFTSHLEIYSMPLTRTTQIPFDEPYRGIKQMLGVDRVGYAHYKDLLIRDTPNAPQPPAGQLVSQVKALFTWDDNPNNSRWSTIWTINPILETGLINILTLDDGLAVYNKLREYAYLDSANKSGGKSVTSTLPTGVTLDKWDTAFAARSSKTSARTNILAKKQTLNYGDKIKLTSQGSYLTLFGAEVEYDNSIVPGIKIIFGSHDDTSSEYTKLGTIVNNTTPEDNSWFYIKGPHAEGDAWNCNIGSPVTDGDIIRLEHVATGRNLTVARNTSPPQGFLLYGSYKGTNIVQAAKGSGASCIYAPGAGDAQFAKKPKEDECLAGLSKGTDGISSNDDNFIIKFADPADTKLCIGQLFYLVQENCKQNLWSQHAYFQQTGLLLGLITALFPTKDADSYGQGWFVSASESSTLPIKDVAWVGIPDGAVQTNSGDEEELEIEIVKMGMAGNLGPGETLSAKMPLYKKEPKVGGYAKDVIPNFSIANIVELSPLLGEGIAWLEESLQKPNQAGIFFRAKCEDVGDIQVYLSSSISLDYIWKVVIGGDGNLSSYILKKDYPGGVAVEQKVIEIFKTANPFAGATPGQYMPYWISIDNGLILVGAGSNLGENIIMVWKDLAQRDVINRVGFGSGKKPVSYAEVRISDPLKIQGPKNFYFSQQEALSVDSEDILTFTGAAGTSPLVFKVPGNGTLVYNINGEGALYCFCNNNNKAFSTDTSDNEITIRTQKATSEVAAKLAKKIMTLQNVLDLQQFFSNKSRSVNDQASIKAISDFFFDHPDHSLKKYLDSLSDDEKTSTEYANLTTMLTTPYSVDIQGKWSLTDLKTNLITIVTEYLTEKFSDDLTSGLYTSDLKNNLTAVILGTYQNTANTNTNTNTNANTKNTQPEDLVAICTTWISPDAILQKIKSSNTVNNHYRLRFSSFDTIVASQNTNTTNMKKVMQEHLITINTALKTANSYSSETMIQVLTDNDKSLVSLLKTIGINTLNTTDINNRISASSDILQKGASCSDDELFKQVFPEPLILFYVQNIPEFTDACIIFEKYNTINSDYDILASSKNQDSSKLSVTCDGGKNFWLSFNKDRFFLGEGTSASEKLLLFNWDINNPYEDIQMFGFTSTKGQIAKIKVGNTIKLSQQEQANDYDKTEKLYDYTGSLEVLSPYEYHLSQNDQQVEFLDIIGKKTLFPGKTPQQGALYYFTLSLGADGFPDLQWTTEPENKIKLELDKSVAIKQATSDALFQASTMVQGGQSMIGGIVGSIASIAFSTIGESTAEDAAKTAANDQNFRANDAYVYTDNMESTAKLATSTIPPDVQANKDKAEAQLELGEKWTPSDVDKLQRLIPLYNSVLDYITHPYVIYGSKDRLFSGINAIYKAQKILFAKATTVDMTQISLLAVLIKAYNNPYLIDTSDEDDLKLKGTWYSYINELANTILSSGSKELALPACYGEYIWLPDEFKFTNKGSISFQAKGSNDIFICFSENAVNVRNSDYDIYEIVFGAFENEKSIIRAKNLDKAVAETVNPDALTNPVDLKQYWVSFNNGRIILGTGDLSPENAIGQYNQETRETIKPEWGQYSQTVTPNKNWLKYGIGDETGFKGKDLLLQDLQKVTDDNIKTNIKNAMAQCKAKLSDLFNQKIYAYQTPEAEQGSYSTDPFFWQDPYFNPKKAKFKRVGISSWNSEITFQNVKVSVCVEEISLYIKNLMAQINNNKDQSIFDSDPTLDDYRKKVLASIAAAAFPSATETTGDTSSTSTASTDNTSDTSKTNQNAPAITAQASANPITAQTTNT